MTKSKVTEFFFEATPSTNLIGTPAEIYPQRLVDELGAFQVAVNQDPDPGAGSTGRVAIEGKSSLSGSTFVELVSIDLADFDGGAGQELSIILTEVQIMPIMRCAIRGAVSVAGGTTVSAWLME